MANMYDGDKKLKKRINLHFNDEMKNMAHQLMSYLGCATISETLRYLIRMEYQKMKDRQNYKCLLEKRKKNMN